MSDRIDLAKAIRGQELTHPWAEIPELVRRAIQRTYLEQADNLLGSDWLYEHDAQIYGTAAKAMQDNAAFLVEEQMSRLTVHSPVWYEWADLAAAIRAFPVTAATTEKEAGQ